MIHSILFTFLPVILDALHSGDNSLLDRLFVSFKLIIELYVSKGIITISKIFTSAKVVRWHLNFARRWSRPLAFLYAHSKFSSRFKFLSSWLPRYLYVVGFFIIHDVTIIFDWNTLWCHRKTFCRSEDHSFCFPLLLIQNQFILINITRKITHFFIQNLFYNINIIWRCHLHTLALSTFLSASGKSFKNMRNSRGPTIDPGGTALHI